MDKRYSENKEPFCFSKQEFLQKCLLSLLLGDVDRNAKSAAEKLVGDLEMSKGGKKNTRER